MVKVLLKCNTPFGKNGETVEIDEKIAKSYGDLVEIVKKLAISDEKTKNDTEQAKEEKMLENNTEKLPKKQNKAIS
jgi:hypothetical protein